MSASELGALLVTGGRAAEALDRFALGRRAFTSLGDLGKAAVCAANAGRAHLQLGAAQAAVARVAEAVDLLEIADRVDGVGAGGGAAREAWYDRAYVHLQYGYVLMRTGNAERAERELRRSLRGFEALGDQIWQAATWSRLSECALAAGRPGEAVRRAGTALERAVEYEALQTQGVALTVLGRALLELGREREAVARLEEAHEVYARAGVPEVGEVRALLAGVGEEG
ncbi:tetratricopeptide repeat protein [Streptomyces sp. NPDC050504]|uniref:tetratricopeptide repeat protein n=1 Tax=Streptomyces sp. NPDC050504 TaxID=3365618 RepID=UPI0037B4A77B